MGSQVRGPRRTTESGAQVNHSNMFEFWVCEVVSPSKTARITEVGMLGVLALRMQKPIIWDAEKRQATGMPEADAIINPKPSTDAYLPKR